MATAKLIGNRPSMGLRDLLFPRRASPRLIYEFGWISDAEYQRYHDLAQMNEAIRAAMREAVSQTRRR